MKAILFLAGDSGGVGAWYAENGEFWAMREGAVKRSQAAPAIDSNQAQAAFHSECWLQDWFAHGWRIHGGIHTSLSGSSVLILRDGPSFWWSKKDE